MKFSILALSCLIAATTGSPLPDTSLSSGKYIVKLRGRTSQQGVKSFMQDFNRRTVPENGSSDESNKISHNFDPSFLNAFSGSFTAEFLAALRTRFGRQIEYIERDGIAHAFDDPTPDFGSQPNAPWGLARISERKNSGKKNYDYPNQAGKGVEVWIVDTGIQPNHTDFGGRAKMAFSTVKGEEEVDMNGHGTHVAGTIAGDSYGVAKQASIFGVKVLNRYGSGQWSDVVAGIEYVAKNGRKNKSVLNMSLGGGKTQSVDDAVKAAKAAGVTVIVAAGNNNGDACSLSPAGAPDAFAVGASDVSDNKASFSNWGKCVKVFAPGVNVLSSWIGRDAKGTNTISGTSMASPHVAGVAALYHSLFDYTTVDAVYADLVTFSTGGVIKGLDATTVNKFVFNSRVKAQDDDTPAQPPVQPPTQPTL